MSLGRLWLKKKKRVEGAPQTKQANKQPMAKADRSVFLEILAELLIVRDISFNIHVEIADEIEVSSYSDLRSART